MAEKTITVIPARKRVGSRKQVTEEKPKLRVAAYCRVSTDRDEQESSYEAQVEHYTEFIDRNPEWQLAGIYADDGISGTNTKKREEFNRMIEDCMASKIDMVITKSISRFARNTLDCLKYIRQLKEKNISVYFEKENINTMDAKGEVLLTIMASLAQQESQSLSQNVKLVGKLPRKDKDGNDTTGDRIGKGGRHRGDGTYSAVAYDLEVVDEDPTKVVPPEPQVIVRREVVEVEKRPTRYEDLPWYQQLIVDGIKQALPIIVDRAVDGAFYWVGRGWNAAVNYGKRKIAERKIAKPMPQKNAATHTEAQKSSMAVATPEKITSALDEIDAAYENYSVNMTSEEAQKEFVDAFILRLLSEKKLWKIAHANIVDSAGNITDGRAMLDKLSSPLMLENINTILKNNPVLLETWQTIALEDILGRELIVDSCYVPIEGQALRKNLMSLSV